MVPVQAPLTKIRDTENNKKSFLDRVKEGVTSWLQDDYDLKDYNK